MKQEKRTRKGLPYPKVIAFFKPYLWAESCLNVIFYGVSASLLYAPEQAKPAAEEWCRCVS